MKTTMKWRNLNYSSSDVVKQQTTFVASDNFENDLIEAKKYCKSHAYRFKSLSKTTYDTFGDEIKRNYKQQ